MLTVRRGEVQTDRIAGCPGLKTPVQVVFTGCVNYTGPDHAKYEVMPESGVVATYDVTITVKSLPAQSVPPVTGGRPL